MALINETKQVAETDTPLLFFQCVLPSGDVEYWSTHSILFGVQPYSARVLKHNLFDLQLSADDAMDGITQLSITLANADSMLSELNSIIGFKGSQLTVYFAFADLSTLTITTESTILFRGIAGDPDEITEDSLKLSFTNKLSLHRVPVPDVRVQRSCPWNFPSTIDQRIEAKDGGLNGRFSRYYRCGYSADVPGGVGSLNNGQPFTACDGSRTQCQQRGMFNQDATGNVTRRFGGYEFVPSAIMVRTSGDKTSHLSPVLANSAKYNDAVPIVYGTGWLKAPVILARNDGNLTHMEVLLGLGTIQGVLKLVVNDIEIPVAVQKSDMTTTGWYNVVTSGTRQGNFNQDFTDASGNPLGDPYGSMSVLSVVVPNRISNGTTVPTVEVLMQGMEVDVYDTAGPIKDPIYSNNPAWVILDILRRSGWSTSDINLSSCVSAAEYCQAVITTTDLNGNPLQVPRFECNLIITKRQSAATLVRGIRVASSLMLRYGTTGLLELLPETNIADQQPTLPDGSNSTETLEGGWPAYEFSDASGPFSGIVRNPNGTSSVRLSSRSIAETSNRMSVEFQDETNEYQHDSLSLVDSGDSTLIGYEISSQSTALGIANFSQATRVLLRQLDKSTKGNLFVQFQTSFRALKVRPGDIITLTYLKEEFTRLPLRVTKLSPSTNYHLVTVLAQIHDDNWYSDNLSVLRGAGRQPHSQVQTPRPLIGVELHQEANSTSAYFDFKVQETIQALQDGTATDTLTVTFSQPTKPTPNSPHLPLLSLSPVFQDTGGSLTGGKTLYYAVSAVDSANNEGALSFTVAAVIPPNTNTNCVTLTGLSFPSTASTFNVYRGMTPQLLYRIASSFALSTTFTDAGSTILPIGPPDANFDHANFYWRKENAGRFPVTKSSGTTIGYTDMGAVALAYSGMVVRVVEGTGMGQERAIASNDQTTLTITPPWSIVPDATSSFVIAESSWKFAAVSATSPAQFEIPYQAGTVIQISGRGANVHNQEGTPDLCPLTRLPLGGGKADAGTATMPDFGLQTPGGGEVTVYEVGFDDLTNASSVSSGTLTVFYWNELQARSAYSIADAMDASTATVALNQSAGLFLGQTIQIGTELMTLVSANSLPNTYTIVRSAFGTSATSHTAGDAVLYLKSSVIVLPFATNFFKNRASVNYLHTFSLPDVRICAAQFFVTNAFGDSQTRQLAYTSGPDGGLRTLSGGQFSIQANGFLATQQNAAPPLLIQATHAVRDIRAAVSQAAAGYTINIDVLQNGAEYCSLTIAPGNTTSSVTEGVSLPPLIAAETLTMKISLAVQPTFTGSLNPGRDLTVTIRF